MTGRLVLLGSPLLGPSVWEPAARALASRGAAATVAAQRHPVSTPDDVLAGFLAAVPDEEGLVLVPHSNAGLYVASLAAARDVAAVVFVDARLPTDPAGTPSAGGDFLDHLRTLADEVGLLPPWTSWWPGEDTAALFPDEDSRRVVEADQPRLPLAYFDQAVSSPPGWADLPAAYLGFGDTYAEEQEEARRRGWAVRVLAGRHLHQLVDPDGVAEAVLRLTATIRTGS